MLFSEYYGEYYACVSEIIEEAIQGTLTRENLVRITQRKGFAESVLAIPAHLKDESWPLLTKDNRTPIRHLPPHPVTLLQKRWLKTLLSDPRIRLFDVPENGRKSSGTTGILTAIRMKIRGISHGSVFFWRLLRRTGRFRSFLSVTAADRMSGLSSRTVWNIPRQMISSGFSARATNGITGR